MVKINDIKALTFFGLLIFFNFYACAGSGNGTASSPEILAPPAKGSPLIINGEAKDQSDYYYLITLSNLNYQINLTKLATDLDLYARGYQSGLTTSTMTSSITKVIAFSSHPGNVDENIGPLTYTSITGVGETGSQDFIIQIKNVSGVSGQYMLTITANAK